MRSSNGRCVAMQLLAAGILVSAGGAVWAPAGWAEGEAAKPTEASTPMVIQDNVQVSLEYTLTSDGAVVDSTDGQEPFKYVHGKGQIIPGLERQLAGLHKGDSKEITVGPDEAYGPVDPSATVDVPKEQLPSNATPEVGMVLRGVDPEGRAFRATIQKISDKTVTLDLNHPLAGKTLTFKVKVIDVTPVTG